MSKFIRFMPDYWLTIFNFEAIAVNTTEGENHLRTTGHFRTAGDYIGINYHTEDFWNHQYVRYIKKPNYTGTKLQFRTEYTGRVAHFDNVELQPAMIIRTGDGTKEYYVSMGLYRDKTSGGHTFEFTGEVQLPNVWIQPGTQLVEWYDNATATWKTATFVNDYDMDFVRGRFFTKIGGIPSNAQCRISYQYNIGDSYYYDFDNLYQGTHPQLWVKIPVTDIHTVSIPAIPDYYDEGHIIATGRSDAFTIDFKDIAVVNGELNDKPVARHLNPYRLAEGFDDEYNKNPRRLAESMHLLGYEGMIDFYIGASHYYDKHAPSGKLIQNHLDMELDPTASINNAYRAWFSSYLDACNEFGFNEICLSVAMENLQCPHSWKQVMFDGKPGGTGWTPPTSFYDPNVPMVHEYITKITKANLDLMVERGFQPILQLGESWYWWQEFLLGDVNTEFPGRPPCFYNQYTIDRFKAETGRDLPFWDSSDIEMTEENREAAWILRKYLGEFTVLMKGIARQYENSLFTVLFFPPSVIDTSRTPEFIQIVNAPFEYWERPELDFIQIEDYDWVTGESDFHRQVYDTAWLEMNYAYDQQHYFSGFVLYPYQAEEHWKLIERAAQTALGKGFAEVFIWAGTQIRRDSWSPQINAYVSDAEQWHSVNMSTGVEND